MGLCVAGSAALSRSISVARIPGRGGTRAKQGVGGGGGEGGGGVGGWGGGGGREALSLSLSLYFLL